MVVGAAQENSKRKEEFERLLQTKRKAEAPEYVAFGNENIARFAAENTDVCTRAVSEDRERKRS